MNVKFKFKPGEKVKTVLGDIGIIDYAAIESNECISYYIVFKGGHGDWIKESLIHEGGLT